MQLKPLDVYNCLGFKNGILKWVLWRWFVRGWFWISIKDSVEEYFLLEVFQNKFPLVVQLHEGFIVWERASLSLWNYCKCMYTVFANNSFLFITELCLHGYGLHGWVIIGYFLSLLAAPVKIYVFWISFYILLLLHYTIQVCIRSSTVSPNKRPQI